MRTEKRFEQNKFEALMQLRLTINRKNIMQWIGFPIEEQYRESVERDLKRYCERVIKNLCRIIIFAQLLMMLFISARPGGPFKTARRQGYFFMYCGLCLFSIFILCLSHKRKKKKGQEESQNVTLWMFYGTVLCIWGCGITMLDQLGGNDLSVFSYMTLCVATFFVFKLWQSLCIFGGNFLLLNLVLPRIQTIPGNIFSNVMNTLSITVMAIFIATVLYRYRVFTSYDRQVIQEQCKKIQGMNEILQELCKIDDLTKLNNRRYLEQAMKEQYMDFRGPITGMMLDIDFFKQYNDTYGHQAGDYCLEKLGQILSAFSAGYQAAAVRYGGEEFFLLFFQCQKEQAKGRAEKLRQAVMEQMYEEEQTRQITISIGVYSTAGVQKPSFFDFIRYCDEALYQSKNNGRNCVTYADGA